VESSVHIARTETGEEVDFRVLTNPFATDCVGEVAFVGAMLGFLMVGEKIKESKYFVGGGRGLLLAVITSSIYSGGSVFQG